MYKNGKYEYKSKKTYENLLLKVMGAFVVLGLALFHLKGNMNGLLFFFTFVLDVFMIVHLGMRFAYSRNFIKSYSLNEL